jgi:ParB/RepB/Spo0J family partition protein
MAKTQPKITLSVSRDIPFDKLVLSQANVRRVKAGVAIEELAEDIARRTLLQSLTVRPVLDASGAETGMYEVPAGGRRYRALELLVKQKRLACTAPVPCIVRTGGIAEEDSLAENVQRAPLHPLDQFRAFLALREKGQSEEDIAAAFFVSVAVVRQRLRLASVSPILGLPMPSVVLFAIIAAAGATNVLSFAILARYFPKEVAGRANAALGVLNMGAAFCLQSLSGFVIARWPADGGHYPAMAHQAAMATGLGLQLIALAVFFAPRRRLQPGPMAHAVAMAMGLGGAPSRIVLPAYSSWTHAAELARRQRAAWAFAAAASATLCVGLAATLSMTISRPAIALHVIQLPGPGAVSRADAGGRVD